MSVDFGREKLKPIRHSGGFGSLDDAAARRSNRADAPSPGPIVLTLRLTKEQTKIISRQTGRSLRELSFTQADLLSMPG